MFLEIDPCLPLLTQIYRYNVHRICLLLCHNNFNGTRWKLKFIIKGRSKVSKIYSSPLSPLLSFTLKEHSTFVTMVFKLYGVAFSTCMKRVAIVLHEKNVPFEFHPIDFAGGQHKSPEFLKHQPFGQIPYIVSFYLIHRHRHSDHDMATWL